MTLTINSRRCGLQRLSCVSKLVTGHECWHQRDRSKNMHCMDAIRQVQTCKHNGGKIAKKVLGNFNSIDRNAITTSVTTHNKKPMHNLPTIHPT